mmetsp:Transcript_26801/g.58405  ORF Transcript_26801/g.58405 Transcript_26801/m.58405 type:complete len:261 (+) Transcript_26801:112-894(+)
MRRSGAASITMRPRMSFAFSQSLLASLPSAAAAGGATPLASFCSRMAVSMSHHSSERRSRSRRLRGKPLPAWGVEGVEGDEGSGADAAEAAEEQRVGGSGCRGLMPGVARRRHVSLGLCRAAGGLGQAPRIGKRLLCVGWLWGCGRRAMGRLHATRSMLLEAMVMLGEGEAMSENCRRRPLGKILWSVTAFYIAFIRLGAWLARNRGSFARLGIQFLFRSKPINPMKAHATAKKKQIMYSSASIEYPTQNCCLASETMHT